MLSMPGLITTQAPLATATKPRPSKPETDQPLVCTGDTDVDLMLHKAKIAHVSKISKSTVYTWQGFCNAIQRIKVVGKGKISNLPLELLLGAKGSGTRGEDAKQQRNKGVANILSLLAQVWKTQMARPPCLSSSKHHAVCMGDGCLDLINLYAAVRHHPPRYGKQTADLPPHPPTPPFSKPCSVYGGWLP